MNIGILGTGIVAKSIAGKLDPSGTGQAGTRTSARFAAAGHGRRPSAADLVESPARHAPTHGGGAHGEIVNALSGQGALRLRAAAAALAERLIDISNPLDFSRGMPPSLSVVNTDSLGEQIQRALPKTKVVKTLNTVNAFLMVEPNLVAGGDHTMVLCGNDAGAKAEVTKLLKQGFGWKDVIDLGDITNARGSEMWLALWVRLYGALETPMFGMKVMR
jgi:hypothetical protein